MTKNTPRIFISLLLMLLCIGILPVSAFASGGDYIDFRRSCGVICGAEPCDLRRHCLHKSLVDHSFTTDKRGNNGDCTSQKFWKRRCSE